VRAVAANQVPGGDIAQLSGAVAKSRSHTRGILLERQELQPPGYRSAVLGQRRGEDSFGLILWQRHESIGHLVGKRHVQPIDQSTVLVEELPAQPGTCIQRRADYSHGIPDLQGARLDANRLRIPQRLKKAINQEDFYPAPSQLKRRR
jgi:hypothetical protein